MVSLHPDEVESLIARLPRERPVFDLGRAPVHVVYGGAHLFSADLPSKLGGLARKTLSAYAATPRELADVFGLDPAVGEQVHGRIVRKLEREPVEDLRIDFEDGYGVRSDEEEDETAARAAQALAELLARDDRPHLLGVRIKALDAASGRRAIRTLDRFVTTLVAAYGRAPERFVVTLPKVTSARQVAALTELLETLEARTGMAEGAIALELMIEQPEALLSEDGRVVLPAWVAAGKGRCVAAHLGTYDLTASLGVAASEQTADHPAADLARLLMSVSLAGTPVRLSDGATTVLPIPPHKAPSDDAQRAENQAVVHGALRRHYDDVRRALRLGLYQGWDLHPAQLVSRYAAVFAFHREALATSTARLSTFLGKAAQATRVGEVFDDAATGQGLLNFFLRGLACGALDASEVLAAGLTPTELATRSFTAIIKGRAG
jgi:citrate lyase beta subunit